MKCKAKCPNGIKEALEWGKHIIIIARMPSGTTRIGTNFDRHAQKDLFNSLLEEAFWLENTPCDKTCKSWKESK